MNCINLVFPYSAKQLFNCYACGLVYNFILAGRHTG